MSEWFWGQVAAWHITWRTVVEAGLLALAAFVVSTAAVLWMLLRLPSTYLCEDYPPRVGENWPSALRWLVFLGKNLLGALLVLTGAVLSLPGVPGPGLLLILVGIMLLNFPGKRRLERKLVGQPHVFGAINRLRARHGKPPLLPHVTADGPSGARQTPVPGAGDHGQR